MAKITDKEDLAWLSANGLAAYKNAPLPSQLKAWGITRDQYKSLYSKAEKDWKSNTGWLGKVLAGDTTNDVNSYLLKQMQSTNGAYGKSALTTKSSDNSASTSAPVDYVNTVASGGGGGGGTSAPMYKPEYYTADQLAGQLGFDLDYGKILKRYQDVTTNKFNQLDTDLKRTEGIGLRNQESAYNQYLQGLRSSAANAVSTGATKGTMAANALASILGMQDANREGLNTVNEQLFTNLQQRGKALATDEINAKTYEDELRKYLGTYATNLNTNDVNRYAAQLAAGAQSYAANVGAGATTNAARIAAEASTNKVLDSLIAQYGTQKGFQTYTDILNGK